MRLRGIVVAAAGAFVLCAPSSGRANFVSDIIGFPLKAVFGSTLDKAKANANAVVANANSVVSNVNSVVNNASDKLTLHENRISGLIGEIDHTLEARVLAIQTQANDLVNNALSQVRGVGQDLIQQAGATGSRLIQQVDTVVHDRLAQADSIIRRNSADINAMLEERTSQIDRAVAERIAQADEAVGRRLGDINVIASEQRLALERTILRAAVLIGMVSFVVFVLRQLWLRHADIVRGEETAQKEAAQQGLKEEPRKRGARRTAFLMRQLAPALVTPALAALCGVALLASLYRWLPSDAVREAEELVALHQEQLADSVARFDYARARMEASHLGYLDPGRAAYYGGLVQKVALIRDVSARPALLASPAGVADFVERLASSERLLGPRPDADLLTLRALLAWQTGATRRSEYLAASLAARALQLAPRGFALAPLARAYVESFLHQPYVAPGAGESRHAAGLDELKDALAMAAPDAPESPFAGLVDLARRMRDLEAKSTNQYVAMVEANARALVADTARNAVERRAQLQARTEHAAAVVQAWQDFDRELQGEALRGREILNVFGLNDALLTRALWFEKNPSSLARRGTPLLRVSDPLDRVQLAPARIAWTRRYGDLVNDRLRLILESEEAAQFQNWERWAIEFEEALIALEEAKAAHGVEASSSWRAAVAAAALGLYVGTEQRIAYASQLAGHTLTAAPPPSPPRGKANAVQKERALALPTITGAPTTLDELLATRGPRLL